jgi:hypothetical protein
MLTPELYGLLLTAAVLAIVVCILVLERYKMRAERHIRQMMKICPVEPVVIGTDGIKKGGSQGI